MFFSAVIHVGEEEPFKREQDSGSAWYASTIELVSNYLKSDES